MGFLKKLFGGNKPEGAHTVQPHLSQGDNSGKGAEEIEVFDEFGRKLLVTKEEWRKKILPANFKRAGRNPDELYQLIVMSLNDGFESDVLPYAKLLHRIDTQPARGAAVLGVVWLQLGKLSKAEQVFDAHIAKHGEDDTILCNLAKVYDRRGEKERVEATLWKAVNLNPNNENATEWYVAIARERSGESVALEACRKIAALPKSWRTRLWLAREALREKDLKTALRIYEEALANAGRPAPSYLLMQMGGDLGNAGYLEEVIKWVEPHFSPLVHGTEVANNLIKAKLDLGQVDAAKVFVEWLYAQNRPDWRAFLDLWNSRIVETPSAPVNLKAGETLKGLLLDVEGPMWMRMGSPFRKLDLVKGDGAIRIGILGSTVLELGHSKVIQERSRNREGRLSRSIPLLLAERIHLSTDAIGSALIVILNDKGFAVLTEPYSDSAIFDYAEKIVPPLQWMAYVALASSDSEYCLSFRVFNMVQRRCVAEFQERLHSKIADAELERLAGSVVKRLAEMAGARKTPLPAWYQMPKGQDAADYLLRMEQQLAVACAQIEEDRGSRMMIFGEREILDGAMALCLRNPDNALVRMSFMHTARLLKKIRPKIFREYRQNVMLLQSRHPIEGATGALLHETVNELSRD